MRWAFGLVLVVLGCDSFVGAASHDARTTQPGVDTTQGSMDGAGGTISFAPPELIIDVAVVEPEPDPDWCTVARQQGATFCEASQDAAPRFLEYCEPAPAAPPSEGGAGGLAGTALMDGGAAGAGGADAGAGGADAGAGGGPGVPGPRVECVQYERPPWWVHALLIQCTAHCGVGIRSSQRQLEGSCCYLAKSEYYGR